MSQPPIVPGDPYEQQPQYQPPPYPQQSYQPPAPVGPAKPTDVVGKTALSTVVVVGVLILIFCVAPMFLCVGCGVLGSMTGGA